MELQIHTRGACYITFGNSQIISLYDIIAFLNSLRPRQNGRHFPDDSFKRISLNENVWIKIKISLKFLPMGPINNILELVQIMAWCRPGYKPLSESMLTRFTRWRCVRYILFIYSLPNQHTNNSKAINIPVQITFCLTHCGLVTI